MTPVVSIEVVWRNSPWSLLQLTLQRECTALWVDLVPHPILSTEAMWCTGAQSPSTRLPPLWCRAAASRQWRCRCRAWPCTRSRILISQHLCGHKQQLLELEPPGHTTDVLQKHDLPLRLWTCHCRQPSWRCQWRFTGWTSRLSSQPAGSTCAADRRGTTRSSRRGGWWPAPPPR
jgi:hypothetical protein